LRLTTFISKTLRQGGYLTKYRNQFLILFILVNATLMVPNIKIFLLVNSWSLQLKKMVELYFHSLTRLLSVLITFLQWEFYLSCYCFFIGTVEGGVQSGPLGTASTNRPIVPAPGDYDDGEFGGMIGRGNRSAPVPLCPPQTPHAARKRTRAAAVGSQRLIAWATARPSCYCYTLALLSLSVLMCMDMTSPVCVNFTNFVQNTHSNASCNCRFPPPGNKAV
jgi:hypothetical protein